MDWDFLDVMDKNVLYLYAQSFEKKSSYPYYLKGYVPSDTGNADVDEYCDAVKRCQIGFYVIWFVFRYILQCETLEEAKKHINEETLKKYKLNHLFKQREIFLGVYGGLCGIDEIYLYKPLEGDLAIILEILYNRYDFFEQLDCFARNTEGTKRTTRNRCLMAVKTFKDILDKDAKCVQTAKRLRKGNKQ